ncbi:HAD family hydrolase [Streptomyces sp. NPDC059690]|uniref:HAD family hydrolase n=1 Tax=Streptomyces sp. NPDC059690 TaxID=3346907 RepID=UPI0036CEA619
MDEATDDQDDPQGDLLTLLGRAKAVLFDFDGPICALFAGRPRDPRTRSTTNDVADDIRRAAREEWGRARLAPDVEECVDSHHTLLRLRLMYDAEPDGLSPVALKRAEDIVTRAEELAVETAVRAWGILTLVRVLSSDLGRRLAVVSNNAEDPIRRYLELPRVRLHSAFDGVFGRDPDNARLMKPDPDCVHRAIDKLSVKASECLLIGDKLSDLHAARSAGTAFLGYTRKRARAAQMKERGAKVVVSSHQPVIRAARELRAFTPTSSPEFRVPPRRS